MATEHGIIHDLVSNWISLALEFANGAADVNAVYVYGSSERGSSFVNFYFEQAGTVVHPGRLVGGGGNQLLSQAQDLLMSDLFEAEDAFRAAGVPRPTEYKVYFEPKSRKLDAQLSRDERYANDPEKSPTRGIEYWLGEKAPKLI